jgi:hypothetical protein
MIYINDYLWEWQYSPYAIMNVYRSKDYALKLHLLKLDYTEIEIIKEAFK